MVEKKNSSSDKLKKLESRVKELEGIIGRKQIAIDYLEKTIEIASEELKVDIKKNSNTLPSAGFDKTDQK